MILDYKLWDFVFLASWLNFRLYQEWAIKGWKRRRDFSDPSLLFSAEGKGFSAQGGRNIVHQQWQLSQTCSKWPLASFSSTRVEASHHTLLPKVWISALWGPIKFLNFFLVCSLHYIPGVVAASCNCYLCYTLEFSFTPFTEQNKSLNFPCPNYWCGFYDWTMTDYNISQAQESECLHQNPNSNTT